MAIDDVFDRLMQIIGEDTWDERYGGKNEVLE